VKIEIKDSANYAATVVRVPELFKLPNSDRLYGAGIFGNTVVVDSSWMTREGELAVFFPAEAQLSPEFTRHANLYRHNEQNANPEQAGYLEDNRRIRALKLRGNISAGLLLPVSEVESFVGTKQPFLAEGDVFDTIDGAEICRKYRIKEPNPPRTREGKKLAKAFKRVDAALFPVHVETDQYLRNEHLISDDDVLIVTQKLHGTSWRGTRTLVKRKPTWRDWVATKVLRVPVQERYFDLLAGSRQVIKDPKSHTQNHFYAYDLWTEKLQQVGDVIPENVIVYGEIVGYTSNGAEIQKGHTYGEVEGDNTLYVYRVSVITDSGDLWDLSWDQVRHFCMSRGLKHVPELWRGFKKDFNLDAFVEKDFAKEYSLQRLVGTGVPPYPDLPAPLSKGGTGADEGIAIRVERGGQIPLLFKYKNPSHYLYETALLDSGEVDLESEESVA
jgi:hypothetical protein